MMWARANQDQFKGLVFDPVQIVISPINKSLLDLSEAAIPRAAWSVSFLANVFLRDSPNVLLRDPIDDCL